MSYLELLKEYESLPRDYQKEVEDFVKFLKSKLEKGESGKVSPKKTKFGIGKGKGWISADFDKPLDDMKDYM